MIFLTVGTHYLGFERLIKKVDQISKNIDEEIIAQIGNTKYIPKNIKYFRFTNEEKLEDIYENARVIISHAGAGTILTIFQHKKIAIIVPRLKKYNEHIDNHQTELADVLKKEKKAIVVYNIEKLENAIKETEKINFKNTEGKQKLVNFLKKYIERIENENMHADINTFST